MVESPENERICDPENFYKLRIIHYLNRIINENSINELSKWSEISDIVKEKFNLDVTVRQLRYMFNEHKYYEDFENLKFYANLRNMSTSEFVSYIENDNEDIPKFTKYWQTEIVKVINTLDTTDEKIHLRQRLTTNINSTVLKNNGELEYLLEIMDTIKIFNSKRKLDKYEKEKKLAIALNTFKALLGIAIENH